MARKSTRARKTPVKTKTRPRAVRSSGLAPNERRLNFGERWSYAPTLEQSDYIRIKPRYQLFIDGRFRAPHSGNHFDSINPTTEEKRAEIAEADAQGAELVQPRRRLPKKGYWYPPSFFTAVTPSHRIPQEIFGPVLSVMTFRTPEEAIEQANNTPMV